MKVSDFKEEFCRRAPLPCENGLQLDVAIIGAGMSGLYSGWRLARAAEDQPRTAPRVQIFELSNLICGRLQSLTLPGTSVVGEAGGMRYFDAHVIVSSLINRVFAGELQPIPFPMGDPAAQFYYARAQRLRQDAWTKAQASGQVLQTNFFLPDAIVGMSCDQLFNKIVYDVLMGDPWFVLNYSSKVQFSPPYNYTFLLDAVAWNDVKMNLTYTFAGPYQGLKVYTLGFWNLIRDRVGDEGYEFLAVAGGYYSNTINWNAAEAFPYMVGDFSNASTTYKTLEGGYDLLGYALAQDFLSHPNTAIRLGTRLETFRELSGGDYRYELQLYDLATAQRWTVQANRIILAMPRRSLELLDQDGFFFDEDIPTNAPLRTNLVSVVPEPAFKLLMGFKSAWWSQFGATAGESITDGPMRQCYYFGVDPQNGRALFLSSYNDMRTVDFWNPLEPTGGTDARAQPATDVMVQETMREVRMLHGSEFTIPDPYVALFKDWSKDPYGGGYHAWRPGFKVWEVMPFMRRPNPNHAIHVCGEAYSDAQGWVEGAFCVAELMLQEHCGLPRPAWLDANYYLGW